MSWLWWYLAGLATIPGGGILVGCLYLLFSRRETVECYNCGKVMGLMGKTPWIVWRPRWTYHYLRYWYRTRPNWTCEPQSGDAA